MQLRTLVVLGGLAITGIAGAQAPVKQAAAPHRLRLITLNDLNNEPDDTQNVTRVILYSNEFDIEAMLATSGVYLNTDLPAPRNRVYPEFLIQRIEAYAKVRDNLLKHANGYPTREYLLSHVGVGPSDYGMKGVGDGKSTSGSKLIIAALEKPDPRSIYVSINCGSNALAQALWDFRKTHTKEETDRAVAKLIVHDNGGQDDAGAWMCHEFPNLRWYRSAQQVYGFMGPAGPRVHQGPEPFFGPNVWSRDKPYGVGAGQYEWAEENVRNNHGPLGALYPQRVMGGRASFMEGGGAASWIGVVNKGLYDPENMSWGGWGGRFTREKRLNVTADILAVSQHEVKYRPYYMYTQAEDYWEDSSAPPYKSVYAPVWRWREAYNNDFQARMDWCVKEYKDANHHPVAAFRGDLSDATVRLEARPGVRIPLDASASKDPDNDQLSFRWFVYDEAGTYPGRIQIPRATEKITEVVIPKDASGKQIHVILEVRDRNPIVSLFDYRRVVIDVKGGSQ